MNLSSVPDNWLIEMTSIEKLKADHRLQELPKTFREDYVREVENLASEMIEGDEIWKYSSPSETWIAKCGSSGLAIRRNGKVVFARQLMMN